MKKILIPFCTLALFSTQIPAASAASVNGEVANYESILFNAKQVNLDRYEESLVNSIEKLSTSEGNQSKNFYKKLTMTKNTLERLLNIELDPVVSLALHKIEVTKIIADIQTTNENTNVVEKEKTSVKTPAAPKTEGTSQNTEAPKSETTTQNTEVPKSEVVSKNNETPVQNVPPKQKITTKEPEQQKEQPKQNNPNYNQTPSKPNTNNQQTNSNQGQGAQPNTPTTQNSAASNFEQQVVQLTNAERAKAGLSPLEMYSPLMNVAEAKSLDMSQNNYFSHTSPTYGSPFDQIKAAGISYRAAGENIAQGQRTPQQVVQAWMDSPGHRQNIMNPSYTHIGVGFVENGYYWTQQFIQY